MIDSDAIHKRASQELFDATQEIYNPPKSESYLLTQEKKILKQRLFEIENKENAVSPEIIAAKKQALARAVQMHRREKSLSNKQLDLTFSQMQCAGETYPFRNKK